ncbi:unnamed protein product [Peronospora destructor]|uniref:Uncharacterized protein n=1 Tax=Peronospora destructor TaxID=86335 RepID=A0AAV0TRB1_9STRA|nr:unnamed protein product [Peronospora destructor]
MRVLKCVFLLAAFAAAVSADSPTEDEMTLNTVNVTDATENNIEGSMAAMTPSSNGPGSTTGVDGKAEEKQDDDAFKIEPQPIRVPTKAPSTAPISPTTDSGSESVPSSTPDETVASSSAAAVAPTAFALVVAVVYAML